MPRAALLSIHARVENTEPATLEDRSLVQMWGPRFSVFVVAAEDRALFSLGRMSDDPEKRALGDDLADRLHALLDGSRMPFGQAGRALGVPHNRLRYAAPTGRVLLAWDGARQPEIWTVPVPDVDPDEARLELARRYLHVFGPSTPAGFSAWAGIPRHRAAAVFDELARSLLPVRTPIDDAWLLAADEPDMLAAAGPPAPARLLPSGDAYYLLQGDDRALLVPDAARRKMLWTSRVWPGAILVEGEIVGIWRRSGGAATVQPWQRLSREARDAIEAEAGLLPLPGMDRQISVRWGR
jgi:hypothetical protein